MVVVVVFIADVVVDIAVFDASVIVVALLLTLVVVVGGSVVVVLFSHARSLLAQAL